MVRGARERGRDDKNSIEPRVAVVERRERLEKMGERRETREKKQ